MNKKRLVNLNVSTVFIPVTALLSTFDRAVGVMFLFVLACLFYGFDLSLPLQKGFDEINNTLQTKNSENFFIWSVISVLMYHLVVIGLRYLLIDFGYLQTLKKWTYRSNRKYCDCLSSDCVSRNEGMATKNISSSLYDWVMQRMPALVLSLCTIFIIGCLLLDLDFTYVQWNALFEATWIRVLGLMVLLSIGVHSWTGLWSILIDFIKTTGSRFSFNLYAALRCLFISFGIYRLFGGYK